MSAFALGALHFLIGLLGTFVADAAIRRVHRIDAFSLSIAPLVLGLVCAQLAIYLSPWLTPLLLTAYAAITYREQRPPPES